MQEGPYVRSHAANVGRPGQQCEVCGIPVQRVFHPVAVHFKGSGFYNTDYGTRKRSREKEAASANESSKESKDSKDKKDTKDSKSSKESSSKDSGTKVRLGAQQGRSGVAPDAHVGGVTNRLAAARSAVHQLVHRAVHVLR